MKLKLKQKFSTITLGVLLSTGANIISPAFFQENTSVLAASVEAWQTKTFVVSAYYSPLPNQNKYVWGSYEADKRMNGEGNRGADFTKVYPGMIAAPSNYPFGTKIKIPGFGVGAVHDRGGRILEWKNADRIDLWMGYGDDGRKRALQWGMKTVTGTIMPNNTKEAIQMNFMSKASQTKTATAITSTTVSHTEKPKTLYIGDKGEAVRNLQKFLIRQNVLHVNATGYYGEKTKEAVYQFQLKKNIVSNRTQTGAGVFGPTTRKHAEKIWTQTLPKETKKIIVASNTQITTPQKQAITIHNISDSAEPYNPDYAVIKPNLQLGDKGEAVKRLQLVLKGMKFYTQNPTGLYDQNTVNAVYAYQIANNIVVNKSQTGAGRFGPQTYSMMVNTLLQKRNKISKASNIITHDWAYITAEQIAMRKQKIQLAKLQVEFGERSEAVKALQNELIARGFLDSELNTGFYGNKTKSAINAYYNFIG